MARPKDARVAEVGRSKSNHAQARRAQTNRTKYLQLLYDEPNLTVPARMAKLGLTRQTYEVWRRQYPDWAQEVDRIRAGRDDEVPDTGSFYEWRKKYLNIPIENPITNRKGNLGTTYPYMRPFVDALEDPDIRRVMCLLPVRHGKTTLVEQYVVYRLCKDPNARIILVCSSEKHVRERVYAIQQILLDNHIFADLHSVWGRWISKSETNAKPWGQTSFYVRGRQGSERSPSVSGYGINAKVYGARADLIILDDVDDPMNGPDERRKILQAINGPILTRLSEGGKMVYIGTRCGVEDVAKSIMERPDWWVDVQSALDAEGNALCEEMYSSDELESMAKDMTPQEFSMMLLNDPAPEGSMVFPPDLINVAKDNRDTAPDSWVRYLALDPAPVGHTGLVVVAVNRDTGVGLIIDAESRQGAGYDGMWEMLQHYTYKHSPRYTIIEEQGGSMWFSDVPDVQRFIYDEGGSLVRFRTTSNKHDPRFGLSLVASKMRAGKLLFAWGDQNRHRLRVLEQEMLTYVPGPRKNKGHNYDCLMALWFAINIISGGTGRTNRRARIMDPLVQSRPWLKRANIPVDRELVVDGRRLTE